MLKGSLINLRPMNHNDLELFYLWNTNQEYMGDYMHAEVQYKETFIENMKKTLYSNSTFFMIIEDKDEKPIGVIDYFNSIQSTISIDFGILIAEKSNRGKGVGREAITMLISYLFTTRNITRVQFMTRSDNEGMKLLGEKIGFKLEGILRKYRYDYGDCRDVCLFGMTKDDWNEKR